MPKIIGLVVAWGCEKWIDAAIHQATRYCDEVIVCVHPLTKAMEQFEDNTKELAVRWTGENVKLVTGISGPSHVHVKAPTLNRMLKASKYFSPGNWVWVLDVDEYYLEEDYFPLRDIIENPGDVNRIIFNESYFMINMQHYLTTEGPRLWKIETDRDGFVPTQRWNRDPIDYKHPSKMGKFHFSALMNMKAKREFWRTEYPHEQNKKIQWIDEIYLNYDLNNEEYWITRNESLFGVRTPYRDSDFGTDGGRYFKYSGPYPAVITDRRLNKVEDFRTYYD